jgi:hypothetical protein
MKMLHLTLKRKWFDMIASGEKKEEYREIKPYWITRLANKHNGCMGGDFMDNHKVISYTFKDFGVIRFRNGYAKDARMMDIECKGIRLADLEEVNPQWFGDKSQYEGCRIFIISLGKLLNKNL